MQSRCGNDSRKIKLSDGGQKKASKMNMMIKAVKFRRDGFYSQLFAFGGEEGMDKFDLGIGCKNFMNLCNYGAFLKKSSFSP